VTRKEDVDSCGDNSEKFFGSVDILINNAGIVSGKNMLELKED
jgi:NADP-dependent 3-hydroxy acid dehydrogenase YdfG